MGSLRYCRRLLPLLARPWPLPLLALPRPLPSPPSLGASSFHPPSAPPLPTLLQYVYSTRHSRPPSPVRAGERLASAGTPHSRGGGGGGGGGGPAGVQMVGVWPSTPGASSFGAGHAVGRGGGRVGSASPSVHRRLGRADFEVYRQLTSDAAVALIRSSDLPALGPLASVGGFPRSSASLLASSNLRAKVQVDGFRQRSREEGAKWLTNREWFVRGERPSESYRLLQKVGPGYAPGQSQSPRLGSQTSAADDVASHGASAAAQQGHGRGRCSVLGGASKVQFESLGMRPSRSLPGFLTAVTTYLTPPVLAHPPKLMSPGRDIQELCKPRWNDSTFIQRGEHG